MEFLDWAFNELSPHVKTAQMNPDHLLSLNKKQKKILNELFIAFEGDPDKIFAYIVLALYDDDNHSRYRLAECLEKLPLGQWPEHTYVCLIRLQSVTSSWWPRWGDNNGQKHRNIEDRISEPIQQYEQAYSLNSI